MTTKTTDTPKSSSPKKTVGGDAKSELPADTRRNFARRIFGRDEYTNTPQKP